MYHPALPKMLSVANAFKIGDHLSLPKMLSGMNSIEINQIQKEEAGGRHNPDDWNVTMLHSP